MFVRFDYQCVSCDFHEERFVRKADMYDQWHEGCRGADYTRFSGCPMRRLPASPKTTFRFADRKLK